MSEDTEPDLTPLQQREQLSESELQEMREDLADMLLLVRDLDKLSPPDYVNRNALVVMALTLGWLCGYETGIGFDRAAEWPVVYLELPTGQVSWHVPTHSKPWDGHATDAKYDRVAAYADQIYASPEG